MPTINKLSGLSRKRRGCVLAGQFYCCVVLLMDMACAFFRDGMRKQRPRVTGPWVTGPWSWRMADGGWRNAAHGRYSQRTTHHLVCAATQSPTVPSSSPPMNFFGRQDESGRHLREEHTRVGTRPYCHESERMDIQWRPLAPSRAC
jgi:hypothetical protein